MANPVLYLSPITMIVQYFTNIGVIAAGAQINTFVAGSVSTPQVTYTDNTGLVANANPMTASTAGRPAGQSGAPVAFWTLSGVALKLVVYDAVGNLLVTIDNISSINDPSGTGSLQMNLANPASGFGVDLVANAIKSYAVFANLRAANIPALASGQTLIVEVEGGLAIGDGLGGPFYWNATATGTDNGTTIINPTGNAGTGRYLRLSNPPFGAQAPIASAPTTDLGTLGANIAQVNGTTTITSFGSSASLARPLYVLTFTGILTLTYNATSLILPGNQNILTAAGDSAIALYLGSGNWQVLSYSKAAVTITGGPVVTLLGTPFAVINNTTLANITGFSVPLIPGNYLIQTRALISGVSSAMGYKIAATFSGTISPASYALVENSANGAGASSATPIGTPVVAVAVSQSTLDYINYDINLVVTVAGTLQFQMAQNSATASNLTMAAASAILVTTL